MTPRHEIETNLKGETLVRKGLMHRQAKISTLRLVPDLNVVKIGGHGVIDYGREVVLPLMEEVGELSKQHRMLVVTGGGVRVRHILDIGIDLGMPRKVRKRINRADRVGNSQYRGPSLTALSFFSRDGLFRNIVPQSKQ